MKKGISTKSLDFIVNCSYNFIWVVEFHCEFISKIRYKSHTI